MRKSTTRQPIALAISDIHLSANPPAGRPKDNWWKSLGSYLEAVSEWAKEYDVPVLCAGDIFDHWRANPELINYAIDCLPTMYAVPGQHDMPHHDPSLMYRSAYGTLERAGTLVTVGSKEESIVVDTGGGPIHLSGFGWGQTIEATTTKHKKTLVPRIVLAHKYVARTAKEAYPGAPLTCNIAKMVDVLSSYDFAIFGDNHMPFTAHLRSCSVINPGCLVRRKSDERKYKPAAWLLFADDTAPKIEPLYLDTDEEAWLDTAVRRGPAAPPELEAFVAEIGNLGDTAVDFADTVVRYLDDNKVGTSLREFIMKMLDK